MKCNNCGCQNSDDSAFCEECGTLLSDDVVGLPPSLVRESEAITTGKSEVDPYQDTVLRYFEQEGLVITSLASGASHIGLHKDEQEDRFVAKVRNYGLHNVSLHISVVADGMGGYAGGEICAEIGAQEFSLAVYQNLPAAENQSVPRTEFIIDLEKRLEQVVPKAMSKANRRVREYLAQTDQDDGGATVVASVVLVDHEYGRIKLFGYSQGDARAIMVMSDGGCIELTQDHAINGKPTRYLGCKDSIGLGAFGKEFWLSDMEVKPVAILLYSDGLWQMLSKEEITARVLELPDAGDLVRQLLTDALTVEIPAGARNPVSAEGLVRTADDNISVIAITFEVEN